MSKEILKSSVKNEKNNINETKNYKKKVKSEIDEDNFEEDKNMFDELKNNSNNESKVVIKEIKVIREQENGGSNEITKPIIIPEVSKPITLPVMQPVPESDNIPFEKLPLRDPEFFKEGLERSPLASFFQSPMNLATSKCHYGSPQAQSGMLLPLSGMGSSCLNQFASSPSFGAHMDFSSLMNPSSYPTIGNTNFINSAFSPDSFSPCFYPNNPAQGIDSFCKAEEKDN